MTPVSDTCDGQLLPTLLSDASPPQLPIGWPASPEEFLVGGGGPAGSHFLLAVSFFPECVAKGSRYLVGSWGTVAFAGRPAHGQIVRKRVENVAVPDVLMNLEALNSLRL